MTSSFIGTVPGRSPLWNLRSLSRSSADEPYHDNYSKDELRAVLNAASPPSI